MQADVVETSRIKTGDGQAALFFAVWALTTKFALALAVGIAFPLLGYLGLDAADPSQNTPQSLLALSLLYAGLPVLLKIAAIALMWRYPLDEAELDRLRRA
jgi:Na+/melibiose symporter-like transporter